MDGGSCERATGCECCHGARASEETVPCQWLPPRGAGGTVRWPRPCRAQGKTVSWKGAAALETHSPWAWTHLHTLGPAWQSVLVIPSQSRSKKKGQTGALMPERTGGGDLFRDLSLCVNASVSAW